MVGELLIGLEIALFFGFVFYIENKRLKFTKKLERKVIISKDNLSNIPCLFTSEFKRRIDDSKNGHISLTTEDLMDIINRLSINQNDDRLDKGKLLRK
jgi:hypothetical protein